MASSSNEKVNVGHQDLSAEQGGPALSDVERQRKEKALVRKLDCFIAPVMMLLMLISYLDRGNIGFAATQGMTADLGLKGSDLNVRTFSPCHASHMTDSSFSFWNAVCSLGVLRVLYTRRIPDLHLCEETPVQSGHTSDHVLLGNRLSLHGFRPILWPVDSDAYPAGLLRRMPVSCYDATIV